MFCMFISIPEACPLLQKCSALYTVTIGFRSTTIYSIYVRMYTHSLWDDCMFVFILETCLLTTNI